jgi:hypothetical protein
MRKKGENSFRITISFDGRLYTNETNPVALLCTILKRSNRNNNLAAMA